MKRFVLLLSYALCLSVVVPLANASTDIRIWPRKHKDSSKSTEAAKPTEAPKPKVKMALLHRSKPSREQAARAEASFGMTGPKSVGWRHPQPGPAGVGAK